MMTPKLACIPQIPIDTLRKKKLILTHLLNSKSPDKTAPAEEEEKE
jgi:hypothetical protein